VATFLELVNDVERESGTIDRFARVSDVTAPATARQEKIVYWVRDAWTMIQNMRTDWRWMRGEFSAPLVLGQTRYTPANLSISDHSQWPAPYTDDENTHFVCHDPAVGVAGQHDLFPLDYQTWRGRWGRNAPANSQPRDWSVDYDGNLCIGAPPDRAWVLSGEYVRTPQTLGANADVPRCPAQFHDIIVWRALMLLGDHDEAASVIGPARAKFGEFYARLVNAGTEPVRL
jgi:hypothetical protein